ncbi:MAG: hypothetical protein ACRDD1_03400 [Planctomycetia bacterium]
MNRFRAAAFGFVLAAVAAVAVTALDGASNQSAVAAAEKEPSAVAPVETDMHEFMEYAFQPPYKRLKQAMAAAPTDKAAWKGIKSDALILAEGGNSLLAHAPKDGAEDWTKFSTDVRAHGGAFYKAAKAKNFETAKTHYASMLKSCNACHDQFADGEHQLTP